MKPPVTTPPLRPGAVTALVAALAGVVVGSVLALAGGADGPLAALRSGVRAWLVAQGSGLEVPGAEITIVPIGGVLLVVALTAWAARRATPEPWESPGAFVAVVAGTSGVVAAVAASATSMGDVVVHPVRAAAVAFVVTGVGAALGATAPHGRLADLWPSEREEPRAVVRAARDGVVVLLGASAVLVAVLLLLDVERAAQLWGLLDPGAAGTPALAVLCVLAVPTLVLWTASVLVGPGFALGVQTSVDLTGSQLGAVPGLPVLAALPSPGAFPDVVVLLGLLPVLAGAVCGWRLVPPSDDWRPWPRRVGLGAAAGGVAGLVVGVLVALSGGSVGPGRLAEAGPPALTPLLVAVPVLALGGAIGAGAAHYREQRGESSAERSSERTTRRPRLRFRDQPAGPARRDDGS